MSTIVIKQGVTLFNSCAPFRSVGGSFKQSLLTASANQSHRHSYFVVQCHNGGSDGEAYQIHQRVRKARKRHACIGGLTGCFCKKKEIDDLISRSGRFCVMNVNKRGYRRCPMAELVTASDCYIITV